MHEGEVELDDYLIIEDKGEFTTCNYGDEDEPCEKGANGTLRCRRSNNVYPDYQGDIIFQQRKRTARNTPVKFSFGQTCVENSCTLQCKELLHKIVNSIILWQCIAEIIGTMMLVLIGCGAVASAVITHALVGIWQVAIIWVIGVALSIYATATISGAHLNPAVSLAFAVFRRKEFPPHKLLLYTISQYLGAILGATILYLLLFTQIGDILQANETSRGSGSEVSITTASIFCEYFPNPGFVGVIDVSVMQALSIEAFGTGVLMFVILAVTDNRNKAVRNKDFAPIAIGATVGILICLFAPYTQAGWNPARDFGPRLVVCFAGWWGDAIPGPRSGFWIYIVGPYIGSLIGALVYDLSISFGLRATDLDNDSDDELE